MTLTIHFEEHLRASLCGPAETTDAAPCRPTCSTSLCLFTLPAASIFSVKGLQLHKDPGKRSSGFPESGRSSRIHRTRTGSRTGAGVLSVKEERSHSLSSSSSYSATSSSSPPLSSSFLSSVSSVFGHTHSHTNTLCVTVAGSE